MMNDRSTFPVHTKLSLFLHLKKMTEWTKYYAKIMYKL